MDEEMCDADFYRFIREQQQKRNAKNLTERTKEIECLRYKFPNCSYRAITPYHIRIDNWIDLFPTNNRWHNLRTGKRGYAPNLREFATQLLLKKYK